MIDTLPMPRVGDTIKAEHIAAISRALKKRTPRNSPTVKVHETADGFYLDAESVAAGGKASPPFTFPGQILADIPAIVKGGTVNGVPVTNGTDALPTGKVAVSTIGTVYAYLEVTITKSTTASGYVVGIASITTAIMKSAGSVPANTSTVLCRQVASFYNGKKLTQDIKTSMEVAIRGYNATGDFLTFWGQA
jgi:hypothetical protein